MVIDLTAYISINGYIFISYRTVYNLIINIKDIHYYVRGFFNEFCMCTYF